MSAIKRAGDDEGYDAKRPKTVPDVATAGAPAPLSQEQIRAMLEETKRRVQERLGTTLQPQPLSSKAAYQGLDPASKAASLAASIAARMQAMIPAVPRVQYEPEQKPVGSVSIDEQGRMVDSAGNVIEMTKRTPELRVNKAANMTTTLKTFEKKEEVVEAEPVNEFFDERLAANAERGKRAMTFVERGRFEHLADKLRNKAKMEQLQIEIANATKKTTLSAITKLALVAPKIANFSAIRVPDVEWWDVPLLPMKTYDHIDTWHPESDIVVNALIQHPIAIQPPTEKANPTAMPVMLTTKERKKLRRQRRQLEEQEKRDKIRLGLMAAPAPKVKEANMMSVLGNDAYLNPTQALNVVKTQIALRQEKHMAMNSARALTKEQKKEKEKRKFQKGTDVQVAVAAYRVNSLSSVPHKFKVTKNAEQLLLTGCAIIGNGANLVVVEGGAKAMRMYKRLMLHRIKWNEKSESKKEEKGEEDEEEEEEDDQENKCVLMWEGAVKYRQFKTFEMKTLRNDNAVREYLTKFGAVHFWDLALSEAILEESAEFEA